MRHRLGSVLITVMSLALGVALLLGVERMRSEARYGFTNTISGTDLIVGARSGSVSLLLSSVFHIGNVTDNVSWETFKKIERNPKVAWTIPLSLGDTHRGYTVLGTSDAYFEHYQYAQKRSLGIAEGERMKGTYDAVLGAEVARSLGYGLGQEIILAHGSGAISFVEHSEDPFTVVGILEPTGTPVDQTVHVLLEGYEAIHKNFHSGEGHVHHEGCKHPSHKKSASSLDAFDALLEGGVEEDLTPTEITAFLVGMKSRADAVMLQRAINVHEGEALTAVLPGVALMELWQVVGVVEKVLMVISILVLAVSLASMFGALMMSIKERRREVAILRSVGARPRHILSLVIGEAAVVTLASLLVGLVFFYGAMFLARPVIQERVGLWIEVSAPTSIEWMMMGVIFCAGVMTALLPAWMGYRKSLADGLTIKL
ncbi:ABC transporter permease [Rubritalea tangerina]|uniref:ABC transporter permease n=1 Tax=Rubritalea tangerina TaxID=430798 RepID=A0ABW4Z9S4_9BACT